MTVPGKPFFVFELQGRGHPHLHFTDSEICSVEEASFVEETEP